MSQLKHVELITKLPQYALEQCNNVSPFYFVLKNTKKITGKNRDQFFYQVNEFYNKSNGLFAVIAFLDELKQVKNGLLNRHSLQAINKYKADLQYHIKCDLDSMAHDLHTMPCYALELDREFVGKCFKHAKNNLDSEL